MRTTEQDCLDALQEAAERLGKSPTKAEYEELDVRPASTTITMASVDQGGHCEVGPL
jgi:Mn-dependent DtxR family transcriptional regulator